MRKCYVDLKQFDPEKGLNREVNYVTEICWYLIKVFFFLSAFPFPSSFKVFLLKRFVSTIGKGLIIKPRVNIHMPWKLVIGDYVWLGEEVFILNFEPLRIGSNVCISQRAFLCGGNHDYTLPDFPYRNEPIIIEDGAWIGASCFVAPGTIVEQEAILTAGSVGSGFLRNRGIYTGNPAVKVKDRKLK